MMKIKSITPSDEQLDKINEFIKQFKQETGVDLSFNKAVLLLVERGLENG